jgi:hypothetical protein
MEQMLTSVIRDNLVDNFSKHRDEAENILAGVKKMGVGDGHANGNGA